MLSELKVVEAGSRELVCRKPSTGKERNLNTKERNKDIPF